jgi:hypothetical protein
MRRCGGRRRRRPTLWGRSLWRLFGLSVGTGFRRGRALRDNQGRALRDNQRRIRAPRLREGDCEIRDGERCGGEQRKTKHCHDNLCPWKKF